MSSDTMVRCHRCKGAKVINSLGGIVKDCTVCAGKGTVKKPMPSQPVAEVAKPDVPVRVDAHIDDKPLKVELCSLEDIFPGVSDGVARMAAMATSEIVQAISAKKKEPDIVDLKMPIFDGYSDALMQALLDEPHMPLQEWKKKHMHNNELFIVAKDARGTDVIAGELLDLHLRNSIRLLYAQSKPVAPRKVDAMAAQDAVAKKDIEYVKYEREQKAKTELEAKHG